MGNLSEAKADLQVALRLKPHDPVLIEDLTRVLQQIAAINEDEQRRSLNGMGVKSLHINNEG